MIRYLAACCLALCCLAAIPAHAQLLPDRVAHAAAERIATGTYQTLVFGVVDGDKTEVTAFGNLDNGNAPDGDTIYEIGSITKTFTATLLAQAVLAGRVTLDTPVAQLLPDFTIPSRRAKDITLGELATQHSGLPRIPSNMLPKDPGNPYADYDAAQLRGFLAAYRLPRDPGVSYEYSNLGFGLLGYALAQSEHATYDVLLHQQILIPLGMTSSGTALIDAMRANLAPGHDELGKPEENWDFDALAGAGAIRSTANDMLRYLKANMGIDSAPLAAAMQLAQQPRDDMPRNTRIGLAWMTSNKGIVWHNGETGGYRSFLGFTADRHHGVVILSNTAIDTDDLGFATLDPDATLAPAYKPIVLPRAALYDYVGLYKLTDKLLVRVFRVGDGLHAEATGQGAFPIFPSAPDEFFARVASISMTFTRDSKGVVDGFVLHQNGDQVARKLDTPQPPPDDTEIALDAATLSDYVGRYKFDFGPLFNVTLAGDQLEAQLGTQPAYPVFPRAKDQFFYKVVDAELEFERDATGKVVSVTLHQNGRDRPAARLPAEQ